MAMFLALVSRQLELSTGEKYLIRLLDLAGTSRSIKDLAAEIIQNCMLSNIYFFRTLILLSRQSNLWN